MTTFLESERLWYRAPELDDAPRLAAWINDTRVRRFLLSGLFPCNEESEREWIAKRNPLNPDGVNDHVVLLFGVKGSDEPIGSAGIFGIHWVVRRAEWGILIGDPANWNQGYAREVGRRMVQYAFADLNLNRVELRVNASNPAGITAYEAVGFVREGTLRQASYIDGAYDDVLMMSVLREEWQA